LTLKKSLKESLKFMSLRPAPNYAIFVRKIFVYELQKNY